MDAYTGIGSRSTPAEILNAMTNIATALEASGLVLRSGGAEGADAAFEAGVSDPTMKEIYLPWPNFNRNPSMFTAPSAAAFELASKTHPAWDRCTPGARKLHARNMHQVLGQDLKTPSLFLVCWTPGGELKGGTAQAIRLALAHNIHIFNIANPQELVLLHAWYTEKQACQ